MVLLATPEGPAITKTARPSTREFAEERFALLATQAPQPPRLADLVLLHEPAGLDLAHAGQRLEAGDDLHLGHDVVFLRQVEELAQVHRPHLELFLQLGPSAPRLPRLGKRLLTGLRTEL